MMSDNEKFINKATLAISEKLNLDLMHKQSLREVLYELSKNYNMAQIEYEEGSLMDMIDMFLQIKRLEGFSESTLRNRFYTLRELDKFVNKSYKDISISDLRMYISHKQSQNKQTTINSVISQIKPFFNWLVEEDYLDKNPALKLKKTKEPIRLPKALSSIDMEKLRNACKDDRERALIEFAFATGMRVQEIVDCNICDINFNSNSLTTIGKGNKERNVLFNDKTKFYLQKYLSTRKGESGALFLSSKAPYGRLSKRSIEKAIENIKNKAEVEVGVTPHTFRNTMATKLAEGGADLDTIQYLLGHESITTTKLYVETSKDKVGYQYKQGLNL